jgi:hypothetical protein
LNTICIKENQTEHINFISLIEMILNAELDKATGLSMGLDDLFPAVVEVSVETLFMNQFLKNSKNYHVCFI